MLTNLPSYRDIVYGVQAAFSYHHFATTAEKTDTAVGE
jgi:hypothetical protein